MAEIIGREILVISGLTSKERQDLMYHLKEEPIDSDESGLSSTALGDFGATALFFAASVAVIAGILAWVSSQRDDIGIKISILKIVDLEITKKTSLEDIQKRVERKGLKLTEHT